MNAITRTLLTLVAATISLSFTRPLPRPRPAIACTARTVCGTCNVECDPTQESFCYLSATEAHCECHGPTEKMLRTWNPVTRLGHLETGLLRDFITYLTDSIPADSARALARETERTIAAIERRDQRLYEAACNAYAERWLTLPAREKGAIVAWIDANSPWARKTLGRTLTGPRATGEPLEVDTRRSYADSVPVRYVLRGPMVLRVGAFRPDGGLVRTIEAGLQAPGAYAVTWDGRDAAGEPVPDGDYEIRLITPEGTTTRTVRIER